MASTESSEGCPASASCTSIFSGLSWGRSNRGMAIPVRGSRVVSNLWRHNSSASNLHSDHLDMADKGSLKGPGVLLLAALGLLRDLGQETNFLSRFCPHHMVGFPSPNHSGVKEKIRPVIGMYLHWKGSATTTGSLCPLWKKVHL